MTMTKTLFAGIAALCVGMMLWGTPTVSAEHNESHGSCGEFDGCNTSCAATSYNVFGWNEEPGMKFKVGRSVWELGGWVEAGGYWNQYGSNGRNVFPYGNPHENGGNGNGRPFGGLQNGDVNMNQFGFHLEKEMHKHHGVDWGFRTDLLFGTDAWVAQTWRDADEHDSQTFDYHWGTGNYGLALPQLYGEVGYCDFTVKAGRFYSVFDKGHLATDRFFYSRSLASVFEATTTQTGVVVEYELNHCLDRLRWVVCRV